MREPGSSSLSANSRPPPAPQQNGLSRLRYRLLDVGAEPRQQRARLVDLAGVAPEIARVVEGHDARWRSPAPHPSTLARELLDEHRRVDDLDLVAELPVVVADRLHAVRARRQDLLRARRLSDPRCSPLASSWNMYSLPVRLAGSPVQRSFDRTPNLTPARAQDVEQRSQRLLEVGLERPGASEPHEHVVLRGIERLERRRLRRTSAAGRSRAPRCSPRRSRLLYTAPRYSGASPFDTRPRRAPIRIGRCSMPTGTLVLAGAARRALPQHLLGVDLAELASRAGPRAARPASAG